LAAGGTPFARAIQSVVLSWAALSIFFSHVWALMPDYTPQQQDLVASKGGGAAHPSGCSNPYEVVLARADESQASLSDSILAGRSTRIGLFSIAYGMWVAVICLVGQVLSLFSDGGKEAMIADIFSILLPVLSGAFIAMLVFGQLACLFVIVVAVRGSTLCEKAF